MAGASGTEVPRRSSVASCMRASVGGALLMSSVRTSGGSVQTPTLGVVMGAGAGAAPGSAGWPVGGVGGMGAGTRWLGVMGVTGSAASSVAVAVPGGVRRCRWVEGAGLGAGGGLC